MLRIVNTCLVLLTLTRGEVLKGPVPMQQNTFLRVQGNKFYYGPDEVYLSGTNPAWINYGNDFGNNQWDQTTGQRWTNMIRDLGTASGNSARVWVHIEGEQNPQFDNNGYVVATDGAGTLISDLRKFLDVCQQYGVFVNLVLWNGALMRPQWYRDLFFDDSKLQSYIDNALIPMVEGLKDHPALGAWEVLNEPEGSSPLGQTDANPCYDFTHLTNTKSPDGRAPGWSGANVPIRNLLKFINWQASAIHTHDPKALVSTGSWSVYSQTDSSVVCQDSNKCGFNHYKDECLIDAGGYDNGIMDFWQLHAYPYGGNWQYGQPWTGLTAADYEMDAPLVIGELPTRTFSISEGGPLPNGDTTEDLVEYLYDNGYNGGWTWYLGGSSTSQEEYEDVLAGALQLAGRTDHGLIDVDIQ